MVSAMNGSVELEPLLGCHVHARERISKDAMMHYIGEPFTAEVLSRRREARQAAMDETQAEIQNKSWREIQNKSWRELTVAQREGAVVLGFRCCPPVHHEH